MKLFRRFRETCELARLCVRELFWGYIEIAIIERLIEELYNTDKGKRS